MKLFILLKRNSIKEPQLLPHLNHYSLSIRLSDYRSYQCRPRNKNQKTVLISLLTKQQINYIGYEKLTDIYLVKSNLLNKAYPTGEY